MISKVMKARLRKVGVFLHKNGLEVKAEELMKEWPLLALWAIDDPSEPVSEEPTDEELNILEKTVARLAGKFDGTVKDFKAYGFDMITLLKRDGTWTFRRLSQGLRGTWYPESKSLADLCEQL